jgi:cellulose synthase/poly-beta-1,6-N-acetylglucosamine synthase-like glycosyltransferase
MATYNCANTIEQTIQSVTRQDFADKELIIIDGGSTDDTLDIIKKNTFMQSITGPASRIAEFTMPSIKASLWPGVVGFIFSAVMTVLPMTMFCGAFSPGCPKEK